jgi:hypothetical protein
MAIYRCNGCGFVGEDQNAAVGSKVACPKCAIPTTFFATTFYVTKLVDRYLATRRELDVIKSAEEELEQQLVATSAPETSEIGSFSEDPHNTRVLATTAQHKPLEDWFATKQIKVVFDVNQVDTTGFFDEAARGVGDRYEILAAALEQICFAYRKGHSWVNIDLSKKKPQEAQAIQSFFRQLYGYTFFSRYTYKKQTQLLGLAIQPAQAVRGFFEGGWVEWYGFVKLLTLCAERSLEFACARGAKIEFQNEEARELDVIFLISKRLPIVIECKSGEFRGDIEKYVRLRRRLGIDKSQFIVLSTEITNEQAIGLTAMYELTFVNLMSLGGHLNVLISDSGNR